MAMECTIKLQGHINGDTRGEYVLHRGVPVRVKAISTKFRAWQTYVTNELHEEANDLSI